jgi:2-hydroxycyclohexanecarboxyl-CoA dehydrogenase
MTQSSLPSPKALADSTALLVGGTAGVGLETARQLLSAGVTVAIAGRDGDRGAAAIRSLSSFGPVKFIRGDASTPAGATDIESEARGELGTIDIMMCSTVPPIVPDLLFRTDIASIPETIAALTAPPMLMTAAVLAGMRDQRSGVIINVASDAGKTATPGEAVIGAAMAAIIMFSRTVAMEAKRDGIRVNVLTPSLIRDRPGGTRPIKSLCHQRIPLDRARRFGGHVVDDAVDAADLVDDAGRAFAEDVPRELEEVRGHAVGGADRAQGQHLLIGAGVAHDADGLDRQQDGEGLPDAVVEAGLADFVEVDGVGLPAASRQPRA